MADRRKQSESKAPPARARLWVLAFTVALLAVVLASWRLGWRRQLTGAGPSNTPALPQLATPLPPPFDLADETSVFATYAGSAACKDCHQEAHAHWAGSHHALAETPVEAQRERAAFEPPRTFPHGTQETAVAWVAGKAQLASVGLSGQRETYSVERVIGYSPLRQFLVSFPGGRLQTMEASFDPHNASWFNVYGSEDRRPGEWGHWTGRGMNWNSMCAGCHNTRVRKNYDQAHDTYRTSMAEPSIGCEACHGPLRAHVDWQNRFGRSLVKDPTVKKLTPTQVMDSCGFCHARRTDLTGDFKPGDAFLDHHDLAIVDHSDRFYPDGQVRDEDYEFSSFLSSRMHQRGVTCLDCHEPHTAKTILPGNWLCQRCHNGSYPNAPVIEPVSHSRHKVFGHSAEGVLTNMDLTVYQSSAVKESGGECIHCHMPQTVYMQRHRRHDHGFTIPDPLLTQEFGIPNACNRCHEDKDAAWSLRWVEEWYGPKMNRPSRVRTRTIARGRQGHSSARPGLLQLVSQEENPYWKAVATGLLEPWAADPEVTRALTRSLTDTNALVRAASVRALEQVALSDSPAVWEMLRARLADPVRNVRVAAAWALRSQTPSAASGSELRHVLDLNADQPLGQLQIGVYHFSRQELEPALQHMRKAVEWDPNSAPLRHELAVVLSALERPREALAQLQIACQLAPQDAEMHYKLGLAQHEAGDLPQTLQALATAVKLNPAHARAWYNLGLAQSQAGDVPQGIDSLLRAESIQPNDARIPYARATLLARLMRLDEARAAVRRALELDPANPDARQLDQQLSH